MRYLDLLRRRDFALLWLGATASVLGDGLTFVSLVWLVFELGGTSADVGLLVVCYTAPVIVGGLAAGIVLDRFDRRRVLIADNVVRGLAIASVPLAAALDLVTPVHLLVVAAVYGLLNMVSLAGIPSMIPSLVPEDRLETANAMETMSYGIGGLAGPALAGVLIGVVGAANVLALDALSYGVFVLCLVAMRGPRRVVAPAPSGRHAAPQTAGAKPGSAPGTPAGRGLGPAVRFVLRTPAVLAITIMFMSFNTGEGMLLVLLPAYVREVLGGDAALYGLLASAFTLGLLVGSLAIGAMRWRWTLGRSIAAAQTLAGLAVLGLLVAPGVAGAFAALALFGLLASPLTIWAQTIRMRLIPEALRGRVFGLLRTLMQSTPPVGGIVAGVALGWLPGWAIVLAIAASGVVPGIVGLVHPSLAHARTVPPAPPANSGRGALADLAASTGPVVPGPTAEGLSSTCTV